MPIKERQFRAGEVVLRQLSDRFKQFRATLIVEIFRRDIFWLTEESSQNLFAPILRGGLPIEECQIAVSLFYRNFCRIYRLI